MQVLLVVELRLLGQAEVLGTDGINPLGEAGAGEEANSIPRSTRCFATARSGVTWP